MPRLLDLTCPCGTEVRDLLVMTVPDRIIHLECGNQMQVEYFLRPHAAQWSDRDAVVVFKDKNGKLRYPGRNDAPTPRGHERIVMKSLREVERFERAHGVRNEAAWFDKGTGRGFDDSPTFHRAPSERERYERFRQAWGE